ncbi:15197_t:CDS:2, partial [Gigaspora rosea]
PIANRISQLHSHYNLTRSKLEELIEGFTDIACCSLYCNQETPWPTLWKLNLSFGQSIYFKKIKNNLKNGWKYQTGTTKKLLRKTGFDKLDENKAIRILGFE